MTSVPIPALLDDVARAGIEGLSVRDDSEWDRMVELCHRHGIPLDIRDSRLYLKPDPDILLPAWIESETPALAWNDLRVFGFFRIDSTNEEALRRARMGTRETLLIYAEEQTAGRGRNGRSWISRPGAGLSFSLLLHPERSTSDWPLLTHVASVALADTLKEMEQRSAPALPSAVEIKWPNDVLLSWKKTAGILLETARGPKGENYAVVGVGINVRKDAVPEELADRATSLEHQFGETIPRRQLLLRYLYYFQLKYELFRNGSHSEILEQWKRSASMCEGMPVLIREGERVREAVTCGLSSLGALQVRWEDGSMGTVFAADVSLRLEPPSERPHS